MRSKEISGKLGSYLWDEARRSRRHELLEAINSEQDKDRWNYAFGRIVGRNIVNFLAFGSVAYDAEKESTQALRHFLRLCRINRRIKA